jgi:hypothetical protein
VQPARKQTGEYLPINLSRDDDSMRQFIRHPSAIPIEVGNLDQRVGNEPLAVNLGLGGLAFTSDVKLPPGLIVEVRIPSMFPMFTTRGRVAWCKSCDECYQLGVAFLDPEDAFRARMIEQICHIENYRNSVRESEGRELTIEGAAAEWIEKFAAQFPGTNGDDPDTGMPG